MNVVIIDSGISKDVISNITSGISIVKIDNKFEIYQEFEDEIGHGTAVAQLFLNNVENTEYIHLYTIKLQGDTVYGYDINVLLYALDYLDNFIPCDLLIICSGIRTYNDTLHSKMRNLFNKGILIFSAFDNMGCMSYPAAFDFVIGIDVSNEFKFDGNDFVCFVNSPINIIAKDKAYRVKWINNKPNIVKGSSFACADIAGKFVFFHLLNKGKNVMESYLDFVQRHSNYVFHNNRIDKRTNGLDRCQKAIVFPFNKEIHSIALNEDLLRVEIVDYYDIRQSGKVGIEISKILHHCNCKKVIKNIEDLDWNSDFDTVVLGHCDKIINLLSGNLITMIIEKCKKYNKFLVSLDCLKDYDVDSSSVYYPLVDETEIPCYNYGKMYVSSVPVLGIFGTSSKQGKYTLQLMLRRLFLQDGYSVGQIGTEPTAVLFGMDYVFPMGYNSAVYTKSNDNISILNKYIRGCEEKTPDIIIVGSQSGTCPYNIFNLNLFTLPQIEFLFGTQPDIIVLSVNIGDNIEYVKRTVKTIEGVVACKVIAFVLFPRKISERIEMISSVVMNDEYSTYKDLLESTFSIPIFAMNKLEIETLYKYIVDYLS